MTFDVENYKLSKKNQTLFDEIIEKINELSKKVIMSGLQTTKFPPESKSEYDVSSKIIDPRVLAYGETAANKDSLKNVNAITQVSPSVLFQKSTLVSILKTIPDQLQKAVALVMDLENSIGSSFNIDPECKNPGIIFAKSRFPGLKRAAIFVIDPFFPKISISGETLRRIYLDETWFVYIVLSSRKTYSIIIITRDLLFKLIPKLNITPREIESILSYYYQSHEIFNEMLTYSIDVPLAASFSSLVNQINNYVAKPNGSVSKDILGVLEIWHQEGAEKWVQMQSLGHLIEKARSEEYEELNDVEIEKQKREEIEEAIRRQNS